MTHASLFSGIGGPEVAAAMMGWENAFHCEINPFGRAVLEYWFHESKSYEDITKTDFREWRGKIDILTGGFPCQPFSYAGKRGGGQTITATSGRRCSALLTKSGPLGLLVKMLLESPLWSKAGYVLTWEGRQLYSARVTGFTDIPCEKPSPSSESAATLKVSDIPSSRCLFQLRLSELPIDETASSSSPTMLQTPTAVMTCETPERMRERAERNGYKNGTRFGSLESQVKYDPNCQMLLRTPAAIDATNQTHRNFTGGGTLEQNLMMNPNYKHLLPTPRSNKVTDVAMSEGLANRNKHNLEEEVAKLFVGDLLPTPTCNDAINQSLPKSQEERNDSIVKRILTGEMGVSVPKEDGQPFRLSPLFTEEMMGFPFLWTTLPFLRVSGEPNPSRPTGTQ